MSKAGTAARAAMTARRLAGVAVSVIGMYVNTFGAGDAGGASRFFYCEKPDRSERDFRLCGTPARTAAELTGRKPGSAGLQNPRAGVRRLDESRHRCTRGAQHASDRETS